MSKRSRLKRPNKVNILVVSDRPSGGSPQNNYVKKLDMMLEAGAIPKGEISQVDIYHDDGCSVFSKGFCDCNPDITVKPI